MQQLLLVLKKYIKFTFGIIILLSMSNVYAEIDLKVQNQIMQFLSEAVANYENEELELQKYSYGS